MKKIGVGDIVSIWGAGEEEYYYIVVDVIDFTQEFDESPQVECEIKMIHPITKDPHSNYINQNDLVLVAKVGTKDYNLLIDYINQERKRLGFHYGKIAFGEFNIGETKLHNEPKENKIRFGKKEIQAILNNDENDRKIKEYTEKLDEHLQLLSKAIEAGDKEEVELQKTKLEIIRVELEKLEYFKFSDIETYSKNR